MKTHRLFFAVVSLFIFFATARIWAQDGPSNLSMPAEIDFPLNGRAANLGDGVKYFDGLVVGELGPQLITKPALEKFDVKPVGIGQAKLEMVSSEDTDVWTQKISKSGKVKGAFKKVSGSASGFSASDFQRSSKEVLVYFKYSKRSNGSAITGASLKEGLLRNPETFLHTTGEYYISQIDEGYELEAIARYTFSSEQERKSNGGKFKISVAKVGGGDAQIKGELDKFVSHKSFTAQISVSGSADVIIANSVEEFKIEVERLVKESGGKTIPLTAYAKPLNNLIDAADSDASKMSSKFMGLVETSDVRRKVMIQKQQVNAIFDALHFLDRNSIELGDSDQKEIYKAKRDLSEVDQQLGEINALIIKSPFELSKSNRAKIKSLFEACSNKLDEINNTRFVYYGLWRRKITNVTQIREHENPGGRLNMSSHASVRYSFYSKDARLYLDYEVKADQQISFNPSTTKISPQLPLKIGCTLEVTPINEDYQTNDLDSDWYPPTKSGWSSLKISRSGPSDYGPLMAHHLEGQTSLPFKIYGPLRQLPKSLEDEDELLSNLGS